MTVTVVDPGSALVVHDPGWADAVAAGFTPPAPELAVAPEDLTVVKGGWSAFSALELAGRLPGA